MNDDQDTLLNEIEESIKNDESDASDQDTASTSEEDDLDVEAELKTSSDTKKSASEIAEEKKQKWTRLIKSGEKTLDDLKNLPSDKWMALEVASRLGLSDFKDETRRLIQDERAQEQYQKDVSDLKRLPIEAKKAVLEMVRDMTDAGAVTEKALRKAMEKSSKLVNEIEDSKKTRKESGQLPVGKSSGGIPVYTEAQMAAMPQEEFNRIYKLGKEGKVIIK